MNPNEEHIPVQCINQFLTALMMITGYYKLVHMNVVPEDDINRHLGCSGIQLLVVDVHLSFYSGVVLNFKSLLFDSDLHINAMEGLSWPSPTAAQAGTNNTSRVVSAAENSCVSVLLHCLQVVYVQWKGGPGSPSPPALRLRQPQATHLLSFLHRKTHGPKQSSYRYYCSIACKYQIDGGRPTSLEPPARPPASNNGNGDNGGAAGGAASGSAATGGSRNGKTTSQHRSREIKGSFILNQVQLIISNVKNLK
ncbi:hypothetical protein L6452_22046 [Arctium lappa]|uniref:Uncharacterized protein n=1 Tax=Arctium lappa TaxID=4217 RepID=A0ACB9AXW4_ARCLA|nr:hypothetical protein L6452_22046 [Arctium lappa]